MLLTDFEAMETLGLSMEAVLDLKGVAGRRRGALRASGPARSHLSRIYFDN